MDEFSFIDSIKQPTYRQASVIKGIGDDAAVFRQPSQDIVTAVDTFVEDVHFSRSTMQAYHVGYRSLAANISDLAAMGSTPAFYLVSIVIPASWSDQEIQQIYKGMADLAGLNKMDLIGGDTVSGKELSVSVTVIGYVDKNKARYRSTAKAGDIIFVTGTLGDSQAGFHMINHPGDYSNQAFYYSRHRMPAPRVSFAKALNPLKRVALNDISDGIGSELNEIAVASNVSMTIYENKLPVQPDFNQFTNDQQYKWKLFGGEDFELVGTVSASEWEKLQQIAAGTQTQLTEIGYVESAEFSQPRVLMIGEQQKKTVLQKEGYTHLKQVK